MVAAAGYSAAEVADLLGLSASQVRAFARDGLVDVARGKRGEYRFSFQDLVLLRVAKDLVAANIPTARVRRSLAELRKTLPDGRTLSELQIGAENARVVVHDGSKRWQPDTGQLHFNFEVADLARRAAPIAQKRAEQARDDEGMTADDWYEMGCDLEAPSPLHARAAYMRALELDETHVSSHVNLGRMLHEVADVDGAEAHYRRALELRPDDVDAAFNLGVVLEDRDRPEDALAAYERALAGDARNADAHFNASALCERLGRGEDALRHLNEYRRLTRAH